MQAWHQGSISKSNKGFGFITPDAGGSNDMLVLPSACKAFGGVVPEAGTQVTYTIVSDKKGKLVADQVQPSDSSLALAIGSGGVMQNPGQHGFIEVDGYVYTAKAAGVMDAYEGEVVDENADAETLKTIIKAGWAEPRKIKKPIQAGVMDREPGDGKFGFIKQDSGGDMFVLPAQPVLSGGMHIRPCYADVPLGGGSRAV